MGTITPWSFRFVRVALISTFPAQPLLLYCIMLVANYKFGPREMITRLICGPSGPVVSQTLAMSPFVTCPPHTATLRRVHDDTSGLQVSAQVLKAYVPQSWLFPFPSVLYPNKWS